MIIISRNYGTLPSHTHHSLSIRWLKSRICCISSPKFITITGFSISIYIKEWLLGPLRDFTLRFFI